MTVLDDFGSQHKKFIALADYYLNSKKLRNRYLGNRCEMDFSPIPSIKSSYIMTTLRLKLRVCKHKLTLFPSSGVGGGGVGVEEAQASVE